MRDVSRAERDRLWTSQRRVSIGLVPLFSFLIVVVMLEIAVLGVSDELAVGLAGLVTGLLFEFVLLRPHRRLVDELGLSKAEVSSILAEERARRSPLAALTPDERVGRLRRRRSVWLVVGVLALVALAVGGFYAVELGGQVHEEGDSLAPLGMAVLALAVGFVMTPVAFFTASGLRHEIRAESVD